MRKVKTIKAYIVSFCILLSFAVAGCTPSSTVEHRIDNPTDKDIVINMDGADLTIPANSHINHQFEYGKHTMTYDGSSVNFIVKPCKIAGFMNPTQSNYIFYKNIYVNEADERATEDYMAWLEKQVCDSVHVIVNDSLQTAFMPFKVVNDLFIEKTNYNWNFSLDEVMPESVSLRTIVNRRNRARLENDENYKAGKFQTVESKLFTESAFQEYMKQSGVEDKITFPVEKIRLVNLPTVKMPVINPDTIKCEAGRKAIVEALDHYNKWVEMSGSDFAKEYDDYMGRLWKVVFIPELQNECTDYEAKDFSYKRASGHVEDVMNKLYLVNFFIVE